MTERIGKKKISTIFDKDLQVQDKNKYWAEILKFIKEKRPFMNKKKIMSRIETFKNISFSNYENVRISTIQQQEGITLKSQIKNLKKEKIELIHKLERLMDEKDAQAKCNHHISIKNDYHDKLKAFTDGLESVNSISIPEEHLDFLCFNFPILNKQLELNFSSLIPSPSDPLSQPPVSNALVTSNDNKDEDRDDKDSNISFIPNTLKIAHEYQSLGPMTTNRLIDYQVDQEKFSSNFPFDSSLTQHFSMDSIKNLQKVKNQLEGVICDNYKLEICNNLIVEMTLELYSNLIILKRQLEGITLPNLQKSFTDMKVWTSQIYNSLNNHKVSRENFLYMGDGDKMRKDDMNHYCQYDSFDSLLLPFSLLHFPFLIETCKRRESGNENENGDEKENQQLPPLNRDNFASKQIIKNAINDNRNLLMDIEKLLN